MQMQQTRFLSTEELRELGLVDADSQPDFDSLTELTRTILEVPVCLVSVIDRQSDRQFFSSHIGLPPPWCDLRQTPLSHSFCRHVVDRNAPLVIGNARENELVRDNGAVAALGVVAYLGVPFHDQLGTPVGALCVIDDQPRRWTDADLTRMIKLARCVSDVVIRRWDKRRYACLEQQLEEADARILDLLAYGRWTDQWDQFTVVHVNELVDGVLCDLSRSIESVGARISIGDLPSLWGNPERVAVLFRNLISNALQFGDDSHPKISVTAEENAEGWVFSVHDNGSGIAHPFHGQVFVAFNRRHNQQRYSGQGIGLAICRRLIEEMGGTIWVESSSGRGTLFRFLLRRKTPDDGPPTSETRRDSGGRIERRGSNLPSAAGGKADELPDRPR